MADVHAGWVLKWWIETIGLAEETGHGMGDFPKLWRWVTSLPTHAEAEKKMAHISPEKAKEQLLKSNYALPDIGVKLEDTLGVKAGDWIAIEASDAKPGTYPQHGKLVGLNKTKTAIELENGLRLHFPKVGYFVQKVRQNGKSS